MRKKRLGISLPLIFSLLLSQDEVGILREVLKTVDPKQGGASTPRDQLHSSWDRVFNTVWQVLVAMLIKGWGGGHSSVFLFLLLLLLFFFFFVFFFFFFFFFFFCCFSGAIIFLAIPCMVFLGAAGG